MMMTPALRKFALTAHVTSSVGWLGAVAAYLAPAVTGLVSDDPAIVRASYLSMELIIGAVIMPLCLAALLTGVVQSLGTEWGLFRHYWIAAKFVMATVATGVLLLHMKTVTFVSGVAASATLSATDLAPVRTQLLVHAVGGLVVILGATALSVYKPWGRTAYGIRVRERHPPSPVAPRSSDRGGRIGRYALLLAIGIGVLALLAHLALGGIRSH